MSTMPSGALVSAQPMRSGIRRSAHAVPATPIALFVAAPDDARHLRAVPREIVRVVVFVAPVLAGRDAGAARQVDEVPAVDVVNEAVAVVVHARDAVGLGPVRPHLRREIGMVGNHAGVDDGDHDVRVADRDVPRAGRLHVVPRRLVEPGGDAPQRVVRNRADTEQRDRVGARDLGERAQLCERGRDVGARGQQHAPERREVHARRCRPAARVSPRNSGSKRTPGHRAAKRSTLASAECRETRPHARRAASARSARAARGRPGAEADLDPVGRHARDRLSRGAGRPAPSRAGGGDENEQESEGCRAEPLRHRRDVRPPRDGNPVAHRAMSLGSPAPRGQGQAWHPAPSRPPPASQPRSSPAGPGLDLPASR